MNKITILGSVFIHSLYLLPVTRCVYIYYSHGLLLSLLHRMTRLPPIVFFVFPSIHTALKLAGSSPEISTGSHLQPRHIIRVVGVRAHGVAQLIKCDVVIAKRWSLPLRNISHCAMGLPLRNWSPEYEWDIPLSNGRA
jgi:hypothetical protein